MNKKLQLLYGTLLLGASQLSFATPDKTQLAVWANEAIIATYTYDFKNYLAQQKNTAKYFSSEGWIAYTKALNDSKLPDSVQKNNYFVSAVATMPPEITQIDATNWRVTMPILVIYQNPQYKQKQNLKVTATFTQAPSNQGVRGFALTSLQSKVSAPPCQCKDEEPVEEAPATAN